MILLLLPLLVICAASGLAADASSALQIRAIPEIIAGADVPIGAEFLGPAGARLESAEARIVTASGETVTIPLEVREANGAFHLRGAWKECAESGEHALVVVACGHDTAGRPFTRRARSAVRVKKGDRLRLCGVRKDLDFGVQYCGEQAEITLRVDAPTGVRGKTVIVVDLPALSDGTKLPAAAVSASAERLNPTAPSADPISIRLRVPESQAPGIYEGHLWLESPTDQAGLPIRVEIRRPELRVTPTEIDLGRLQRGDTVRATLKVEILPRGAQTVVIDGPALTEEGRAKTPSLSRLVTAGASTTFAFVVPVRENVPYGRYRTYVNVRTPAGEVAVPVEFRIVRPPLSSRAKWRIVLVGMFVLTLLLLFLARGFADRLGLSPMTRYLLISGAVHALFLFLLTSILVHQIAPEVNPKIPIVAVRLAGFPGLSLPLGEDGDEPIETVDAGPKSELERPRTEADLPEKELAATEAEAAAREIEIAKGDTPETPELLEAAADLEATDRRPEDAERDAPETAEKLAHAKADPNNVRQPELARQETESVLSERTIGDAPAKDAPSSIATPQRVAAAENILVANLLSPPPAPATTRDDVAPPVATFTAKREAPSGVPAGPKTVAMSTATMPEGAVRVRAVPAEEIVKMQAKPLPGAPSTERPVPVMIASRPESSRPLSTPESPSEATPTPKVTPKRAQAGLGDRGPKAFARVPRASADVPSTPVGLRISAATRPAPRASTPSTLRRSDPVAVVEAPATLVPPRRWQPSTPAPGESLEVPSMLPGPVAALPKEEESGPRSVDLSRPRTQQLSDADRPPLSLPAELAEGSPVAMVGEIARAPGIESDMPLPPVFGPVGIPGAGGQATEGRIVITTAKYKGDWDCDRTAMPNLSFQIERRTRHVLATDYNELVLIDSRIFESAFVFISGHRDFRLTSGEVAGLRRYLLAGGSLWVNDSTHEGDETFDGSFRREIRRVLPKAKLQRVPADHDLFRACYDLSHGYMGYRMPPGDKYRVDYLEGVSIDERLAVLYTRNDYGDGLEIDEATFPLMNSLTDLSPRLMQEGSVRMGMNVAFYFLGVRPEVRQDEALKLARLRSAVDAHHDKQKRQDESIAAASGRTFAELAPNTQWQIQGDWGDPVQLAAAANGCKLTVVPGAKGKAVVGRDLNADLSGIRHCLVEIDNRTGAGARVAIAFSVGEQSKYFESAPRYARPGANTLVFDLQTATFKTADTKWRHTTKLADPGSARRMHILVYPIRRGDLVVRGCRFIGP